MSEVGTTIERLVQRHGQFNGKDVSRYLHDYKSEILGCGISEGPQVLLFNRIATDGLQGSIHTTQQQHPTLVAFEAAMKSMYSMEESSKATQRGLED